MKKYLHEIKISSSKVTQEQFDILEKFGAILEIKKPENYYSDKTGEEKIADQQKKFEEDQTLGKIVLNSYGIFLIVDLNLFVLEWTYPFEISKRIMVDVEPIVTSESVAAFVERFENAANTFKNTFNEKVNVHIGGSQLMTVNKTLLLENSCTDNLQDHLDKGWRIIACCVQPDGRRPDYVLGRYEPQE